MQLSLFLCISCKDAPVSSSEVKTKLGPSLDLNQGPQDSLHFSLSLLIPHYASRYIPLLSDSCTVQQSWCNSCITFTRLRVLSRHQIVTLLYSYASVAASTVARTPVNYTMMM